MIHVAKDWATLRAVLSGGPIIVWTLDRSLDMQAMMAALSPGLSAHGTAIVYVASCRRDVSCVTRLHTWHPLP